MNKHHPDIRFLTDYAAGSLPPSQAACVAAHLHYCRDCCRQVEAMQDLGGALFDCLDPVTGPGGDFDSLMARIDALPPEEETGPEQTPPADIPALVLKISKGNLDSLRWSSLGKSIRYSPINLGEPTRGTAFLHIRAGCCVPHHKHRGDEIMVVLKGGFTDNQGSYGQGDFVMRSDGDPHAPRAFQDQDCLCIATLDAPLHMTNPLYRLLMPLLIARVSRRG